MNKKKKTPVNLEKIVSETMIESEIQRVNSESETMIEKTKNN